MSSTKQYTPTTTARPTWRDREAQKERNQREAATRAAEEQQRKKIAKTEENFPTTIKPSNRMTIRPEGKFAELAAKWQVEEELYRTAKNARERKIIYDTVMFIRSGGAPRESYDEDDYEEDYATVVPEEESLEEKFPPHGKRGTYTAPDSEGWRLVTKKTRKQRRELTEAELVQKYRDEFFGEGDEEDADHNGDLTERNQRREFY
jgi:hypothetical protein